MSSVFPNCLYINFKVLFRVNFKFQDQDLVGQISSLARKLSTSSTRTLPPSYSKVDLTSVGLTLNDHLNPPPTYDRLIAMLESGEITSVPIHLHPEVERRISMASSYTANNQSRRESTSSSRKSSRGTEFVVVLSQF